MSCCQQNLKFCSSDLIYKHEQVAKPEAQLNLFLYLVAYSANNV